MRIVVFWAKLDLKYFLTLIHNIELYEIGNKFLKHK